TTASNVTYNSMICHQNYQMWAKDNPHWVQESNQNAVMVWCGIHNRRVIGLYFFEEAVNTAIYLRFLEIHLSIILNNMQEILSQKLVFQHDDAPPHYATKV
ncbi:hypothetical protein WN51_07135, partial [Melipona quadrifasciata]